MAQTVGRYCEAVAQTMGRHSEAVVQTMGRHCEAVAQTMGRHCEDVKFTTFYYSERDGGGRPQKLCQCSQYSNVASWVRSASAISNILAKRTIEYETSE